MSDLEIEPRASRRLWISAAVGAIALHLGGAALAVAHLQTDDFDDDLGAPAIEIGLEMMAVRAEPSELPSGPDSDASVASQARPEQKAEIREADLPKDTPSEADNPDRAVTQTEVKKPVEEQTELAAVQTSAAQESVAAEATATPGLDVIQKGPRSVAPAQGTGDTARRVRATWQKELIAHLDRHKRYPSDRAHKAAELLVGFALDRFGHVLSVSIVKGSGDPAFDEAALQMVRRSDPVPQPPPLIADEGLNFTLPVIFRVKGKS